MAGKGIVNAIQEQYFFEGNLNTESMGILKFTLNNGRLFTFGCDGDAESLSIKEGGFTDKEKFQSECPEYKWEEKEFLSPEKLKLLGKITKVELEWIISEFERVQCGCKINFSNKQFIYIWTIESDNIFYGLNETPSYHNRNLKIELEELK